MRSRWGFRQIAVLQNSDGEIVHAVEVEPRATTEQIEEAAADIVEAMGGRVVAIKVPSHAPLAAKDLAAHYREEFPEWLDA